MASSGQMSHVNGTYEYLISSRGMMPANNNFGLLNPLVTKGFYQPFHSSNPLHTLLFWNDLYISGKALPSSPVLLWNLNVWNGNMNFPWEICTSSPGKKKPYPLHFRLTFGSKPASSPPFLTASSCLLCSYVHPPSIYTVHQHEGFNFILQIMCVSRDRIN